jgi:7-cyano-7-deazaguanine synthase in queuosine biosynthesis
MRAQKLTVGAEINNNRIHVSYLIDTDFDGSLVFEFPFQIESDNLTRSTIGLWTAAFLGQFCLADEIQLKFPVYNEMLEDILPIIGSMYDVRCYRDNLPLFKLPSVVANCSTYDFLLDAMKPIEKRACMLWTGGKDSTLGILYLQKNGYDVVPIHFLNGNVDTADEERWAIDRLAEQMRLVVQTIKMSFPDFVPIATRYSKVIHRKPYENSIPHGRELLFLGPALLAAKSFRASSVCIASGNEDWTAKIVYQGKTIWRWDTASEDITIALQKFIYKYMQMSVNLFPPTAFLSDFQTFATLLIDYPDLLGKSSCCHFGAWCGECSKCVRYYLYQRALGKNIVSFKHDPAKENNWFLNDVIINWRDRETSYWSDLHYSLYTIVNQERNKLEPLLQKYKDNVFPFIESEIHLIRDKVLGIQPVSVLPQTWKYSL